ncbi:dihydrofolate reductase [Candidatus Saccharibacteria bacterium]|nr:dihydrofolate reductase [Candidatus Saccharibacteria bacterium]
MSFSEIAAVGRNRELGKKGGLVFDIPSDLQFFKKITLGKPVFMGLNTLKSLPKKLPGRKHYVLARTREEVLEAARDKGFSMIVSVKEPLEVETDDILYFVDDLEEFIEKWEDSEDEMFVIGGGMVYAEMLSHVEKLYLTEVDGEDDKAEVFFPEFDKSKFNREIIGKGADHDLTYTHVLYTRK